MVQWRDRPVLPVPHAAEIRDRPVGKVPVPMGLNIALAELPESRDRGLQSGDRGLLVLGERLERISVGHNGARFSVQSGHERVAQLASVWMPHFECYIVPAHVTVPLP